MQEEKIRKQKSLAEWQEEQRNSPKKVPKIVEIKNEFKELMKTVDEKNLRFFYFRKSVEGEYLRSQGVTVVTLLSRGMNTLKMAFSFCDNQDNFCKIKGKLEALKRLINPDKFYHETKFTGDSLVDTAIIFNNMKKPIKFKKWKFEFSVYLKSFPILLFILYFSDFLIDSPIFILVGLE